MIKIKPKLLITVFLLTYFLEIAHLLKFWWFFKGILLFIKEVIIKLFPKIIIITIYWRAHIANCTPGIKIQTAWYLGKAMAFIFGILFYCERMERRVSRFGCLIKWVLTLWFFLGKRISESKLHPFWLWFHLDQYNIYFKKSQ